MRASLSLVAVMVGFVGASMASPLTPTSPFTKRHPPGPKDPKGPKHGPPGPGGMIAAIGPCTMDCWNEAAASAGCDPNADDKCLCGPFFDDVISCTSALCSVGDNLATLDNMETACN